MAVYQNTIEISTRGKGTYEFTDRVIRELEKSELSAGAVTVFCRHTSCSLVIMENADRSARTDLEQWMERLVPENDPHFEHTMEGPDDMPSHIKMALTRTTEVIPFSGSRLMLGTWQGVFLWEHRSSSHTRSIVISIQGE